MYVLNLNKLTLYVNAVSNSLNFVDTLRHRLFACALTMDPHRCIRHMVAISSRVHRTKKYIRTTTMGESSIKNKSKWQNMVCETIKVFKNIIIKRTKGEYVDSSNRSVFEIKFLINRVTAYTPGMGLVNVVAAFFFNLFRALP